MTHDDFIVWRNVAIIPCIVGTLWFMSVILCREWVKRDLRDRICMPIHIRWLWWPTNRLRCSFRVIYSDAQGQVHRASCWTYWLRPGVKWDADEIIDYKHEPMA